MKKKYVLIVLRLRDFATHERASYFAGIAKIKGDGRYLHLTEKLNSGRVVGFYTKIGAILMARKIFRLFKDVHTVILWRAYGSCSPDNVKTLSRFTLKVR